MTIKVEPLYDRVLLKMEKLEEKSESGLILVSGGDEDDIFRGKVIAVGEGRILENGTLVPTKVSEDDIVLFDIEDSAAFTLKGQEYFLLPETAIYAILK